jgi:hypothetical protein
MGYTIDTARIFVLLLAVVAIICGIIGYIYSISILQWTVILLFIVLLSTRAIFPDVYVS